MMCPKCQSENVSIQIVTEIENKHHSVLWWVFVGWWWVPFKWLCFFWIAFWVKLLGHGRQKTVTKRMAVCQGCGYSWEARA